MYMRIPTILVPLFFLKCLYVHKKFTFIKINLMLCDLLIFDNKDIEIINFFKTLKLDCISVIKKSRIIVIKDVCAGLIYKYSYKDSIREIQNNYSALMSVENLDSPKCIHLIKGKVGVFSSERLINAKEFFLSDFSSNIYSNSIFKSICVKLQEYHFYTLKKVKINIINEMSQYDFLIEKENIKAFDDVRSNLISVFNLNNYKHVYKAKIHGDVTYRNILKSNKDIYFIDFERAAFDFPEFDYLNFILDFNVHSTVKTSYRDYIDYLVDMYIDESFLNIFNMLAKSGNFKSKNSDSLHLIYLKYLIRQISIITNVSNYQRDVRIDLIYTSINQKIELKNKDKYNDA